MSKKQVRDQKALQALGDAIEKMHGATRKMEFLPNLQIRAAGLNINGKHEMTHHSDQGRTPAERLRDERMLHYFWRGFKGPFEYVAENFGEIIFWAGIAFCLALLFAP
jgi:hypothetical protein